MNRTTQAQLLKRTSRRGEMARNREFLEAYLEAVKKVVLKQGSFDVPKFAAFRVVTLKARKIRNPVELGMISLPKMKTVKARVSSDWRYP